MDHLSTSTTVKAMPTTSRCTIDQDHLLGSSSSVQHGVNIVVSNEYELLSNEECMDDNNDEMPTVSPIPTRTNPAKAKKVRIPPISVVNQTTRQLRDFMAKCSIAQHDYHMKATKTGVFLHCMGEDSFRSTVDGLKKSNIEFHTYTPSSDKPVRIVLSGLPVYEAAEVKTELLALGVPVTEVNMFSRKVIGLEESALYLLHFTRGTVKLSELQKVRAIFNVVVKWRYYERRPTDAVQCHRCQRFGHGMRNCNLHPLCVKCGEKHLSSECNLPKKEELKKRDKNETRGSIKCANCSGQHTANYRGCPTRRNYIEKLANLKAARRHPQPPPPLQRGSQNLPGTPAANPSSNTYAQVLANQESSNENLFTMSEFLGLAREMFDRLANCQTKHDQLLVLFELTAKYIYNV